MEDLVVQLAELDVGMRWNVRSEQAEYQKNAKWHPANDRLEAYLRSEIARNSGGLNYTPHLYRDHLQAALYGHDVDPLLEWVKSLPAWDGQDRIDYLLTALFQAVDSPLTQWASRFPIMGVLKRAVTPGAKLDEMPVYLGKQGIGKSTFLRHLLPAHMRDYFGDELSFRDDAQRRFEATLGKAILEVSEMSGSKRAEVEDIKAFLSRQVDERRLAYGHNVTRLRRRYIVCGTTNDQAALPNDASGNRRFVVAELNEPVDGVGWLRQWLDDNRNQLWAEGWKRVNSGEQAHLPESLRDKQREANETYRDADEDVEEAINQVMLRGDEQFPHHDADQGTCRAPGPQRSSARQGTSRDRLGDERASQQGPQGSLLVSANRGNGDV